MPISSFVEEIIYFGTLKNLEKERGQGYTEKKNTIHDQYCRIDGLANSCLPFNFVLISFYKSIIVNYIR